MQFLNRLHARAATAVLALALSAFARSQDVDGAVNQSAAEPSAEQEPAPPPGDNAKQPDQGSADAQGVPASQQQPKRILGVMPNFRAVSAGQIPPPPGWKGAFKIATNNSFDYSAFLFAGFTSAIADASGTHRALGHGVPGYWAYYWRGFVDKTDGNYMVLFALPVLLHEDERYFAMGKGGIGKRAVYAASRILITRDYQGHSTFNASELLGRGIAQGISISYYPNADRTAGALASRWGYALTRDALMHVFREFWPDIATHVLHRHP